MTDTWYEILEWCSEGKNKKERIARLQKNSGPQLKQILGYTFDKNIKWLLPEGPPPYKPVDNAADIQGQFKAELRRLYLFVEGNTETQQNLKPVRREQLFIELLEAIDSKDATLLVSMTQRKLPFKNLTRDVAIQAFPNVSKNW